jgi:hypothetical protein
VAYFKDKVGLMDKKPDAKTLRKMAEELKAQASKIRQEKQVKCAKYIVGMTALIQLKNKLENR